MRRLSLRSSRGSDAGSLLEGCVDVRTKHLSVLSPSGPTVAGPPIGTGFSGSLLWAVLASPEGVPTVWGQFRVHGG